MDERPFSGTAALVTGGGRRIGARIVERLATLGCEVVIHAHESGPAAFQLASRLQAKGHRAAVIGGDLAKPKEAAGLVAAATKTIGRPLDFLVNNASPFPEAKLADLSWTALEETLKVTAWAPFELTRAFAGQVPSRRNGAVVNLLDARIADYDWEHAGYHLAKRMLADFTRLCAVEYAPAVTVNGVAPGPVSPPHDDASFLERMRRHLPLRKTPTQDDVADAVLYLLGARSVTGQVLFVDSGRHLGKAVYE